MFCGHCGEAEDARDHASCRRQLEMEPPRFCVECRRRMTLKGTPRGGTAECVQHGARAG